MKLIDDIRIFKERLSLNYTWVFYLIMYIVMTTLLAIWGYPYLPEMDSPLMNYAIHQVAYNLLYAEVLVIGIIVIMKCSNRSMEIRMKEKALKIAGFVNVYNEPPTLLSIESKGRCVIYHLYSTMIPLQDYLKKKDILQNAWGVEIRDMNYGKTFRHIDIKAVVTSIPDLILWDDSFISNKDFELKLGQGDFEEISIDLDQYPHVLLASGTGGG